MQYVILNIMYSMHCTEFHVLEFEPGCILSLLCTPEEGECDGVGLTLG